ncbi:hypothetical protein LTR56_016086 [Elasticomyces elasticus]|nr:hypothetical protein LTR56_016086 [Elasticomyces elasticus]KAK3653818.1 hypothetical protein LTR22_011033 [Elasticomyces elasticus]KAK4916020.1 hypothetical protein LTR49_015931 [Elasticomyces elasticus]KAK5755402.1 hypothetical protein LTS12_014509 [Elasticomyces elasticus]
MSSGKYAFAKGLKELRFHHCQTSEHSNAIRYIHTPCAVRFGILTSYDDTRSFLTRAYPTMKRNNPHTPIMIREALDVGPRVYARYEFGREKMADLRGLDDKAIEDKVTGLVKDAAQ